MLGGALGSVQLHTLLGGRGASVRSPHTQAGGRMGAEGSARASLGPADPETELPHPPCIPSERERKDSVLPLQLASGPKSGAAPPPAGRAACLVVTVPIPRVSLAWTVIGASCF